MPAPYCTAVVESESADTSITYIFDAVSGYLKNELFFMLRSGGSVVVINSPPARMYAHGCCKLT